MTAFVIHPGDIRSVPWGLDVAGDGTIEGLHALVTPRVEDRFGADTVLDYVHVQKPWEERDGLQEQEAGYDW